MAYLIYGHVLCDRESQKNRSSVFIFHSNLDYASHCHDLDGYGLINDCKSIGTTFESLRFVV